MLKLAIPSESDEEGRVSISVERALEVCASLKRKHKDIEGRFEVGDVSFGMRC